MSAEHGGWRRLNTVAGCAIARRGSVVDGESSKHSPEAVAVVAAAAAAAVFEWIGSMLAVPSRTNEREL